MPFVLDSSVAQHGALVPALWWWEIQNALLMTERRKRIKQPDVETALSRLALLPIKIAAFSAPGRELALARQLQLSVYDASYLALALEHGRMLMTRDVRLASAARSLNALWEPV